MGWPFPGTWTEPGAIASEVMLKPLLCSSGHDADAGRRREVEPVEPLVFGLARPFAHQRQAVADSERAPVEPAEAAAQVGGDAVEHRGEREAALDREVDERAPGQ